MNQYFQIKIDLNPCSGLRWIRDCQKTISTGLSRNKSLSVSVYGVNKSCLNYSFHFHQGFQERKLFPIDSPRFQDAKSSSLILVLKLGHRSIIVSIFLAGQNKISMSFEGSPLTSNDPLLWLRRFVFILNNIIIWISSSRNLLDWTS